MSTPQLLFVIIAVLFLSMFLIIRDLHSRNRRIISAMPDGSEVKEDDSIEIRIDIKVAGTGFATPEELDIRNAIEDAIHEADIGTIVDAGSGMGEMNLAVEIYDDPEHALAEITSIVKRFGVLEKANIRIHPPVN